ncbi:unnamed protein product [Amoebophrya sp. A120]|nr:unnamed protein product [Amoebophrya sp. A120]|eukprot:GSA120T00000790001.1
MTECWGESSSPSRGPSSCKDNKKWLQRRSAKMSRVVRCMATAAAGIIPHCCIRSAHASLAMNNLPPLPSSFGAGAPNTPNGIQLSGNVNPGNAAPPSPASGALFPGLGSPAGPAASAADLPCPGLLPRATNVGPDCWAKLWVAAGCLENTVPPYEQWHASQSLEVLLIDAQQWATLPDAKHRKQCYGREDAGPPAVQGAEQGPGAGSIAAPGVKPPSSVNIVYAANSDHFVQLVQKNGGSMVSIVNFGSEMCGFCTLMAPVFELLAEKFRTKYGPEKIQFLYIDVQTVPDVGDAFGVQGLPAFRAVVGNAVIPHLVVDGADTAGLERMVEEACKLGNLAPVTGGAGVQKAMSMQEGKGTPAAAAVTGASPGSLELGKVSDADLAKTLKALRREIRTRATKLQQDQYDLKGALYRAEHVVSQTESTSATSASDPFKCGNDHKLQDSAIAVGTATSSSLQGVSTSSAQAGNAVEQVLIIGAGPAGLAAALYAARAGLCPLVVAPKFTHVGQLMGKGVDVENYPALERTTGVAMVSDMRLQAEAFGVRFLTGYCNDITVPGSAGSGTSFEVSVQKELTNALEVQGSGAAGTVDQAASLTSDMFRYEDMAEKNTTSHTLLKVSASSVIFATGAASRWLNVPGEYELRGKGISSCAACDGFLFRGKKCVVIGGGDTAMEEALFLLRVCAFPLKIIHRRDAFHRASKALSGRVHAAVAKNQVEIHWNSRVVKFLSLTGGALSNVEIESTKIFSEELAQSTESNRKLLDADAAFVAIGHQPNTGVLQGKVGFQGKHEGYLSTAGGLQHAGQTSTTSAGIYATQTTVPGLFAAGDVADPVYRQAITSAGSGAQAALDAERWLTAKQM